MLPRLAVMPFSYNLLSAPFHQYIKSIILPLYGRRIFYMDESYLSSHLGYFQSPTHGHSGYFQFPIHRHLGYFQSPPCGHLGYFQSPTHRYLGFFPGFALTINATPTH